jgi:hypothetical protein
MPVIRLTRSDDGPAPATAKEHDNRQQRYQEQQWIDRQASRKREDQQD